MIAVYIPALSTELFTIFYVIKSVTLEKSIGLWAIIDLCLWNIFLSVPSIVAIFYGENVIRSNQSLKELISKYSNTCSDDESIQKVKS
jgi:hypothetical protein